MADKYAAVDFAPEEVSGQKTFLKAMNGFGIIQLSDEELELHMEDFQKEKHHCTNRLVLHGEDDVQLFEHTMKVFFPEKEYEITDDPNDESFARWLEAKKSKVAP